MARTPSKRWVKMVERMTKHSAHQYAASMRKDDAATILSRQHARFVRLVKKLPTYDPATTVSGMQRIDQGQWVRLDTILAALQQGGKR